MAGTDDKLQEYLAETLRTLDAAYQELLRLHNHHYPKCGGGCPAHYVLIRLTEQTIRTQALRTALGYTDQPEDAPEA